MALANVLNEGAMRARFHAGPMVQATELLLQERTPRDVLVARPRAEEVAAAAHVRELAPPVVRQFTSPNEIGSADPSSFQWALCSDGDYRGIRI